MARNAAQIAKDVLSGARNATETIRDTLHRITQHDAELKCFRDVFQQGALDAAASLDKRRKTGQKLGRLAGVPFAVKDLYDVAGLVTLAGAASRRSEPPAQVDAALVRALKAEDAVLVGTLNMDEFAYGFSTENQHFGTTRNPHDRARIAGGSSGGSAAAVAAGLLPLALGSDTNGSVRVPASLCGVYGLKPTYGRLSLEGVMPFVPSLDHAGVFAGTVEDLRLAWDVLAGTETDGPVAAARLGTLQGWFRETATAEALAAVDGVAEALDAVRPALLPEAGRARSAAFCITAAEAGTLHLDRLRRQASEYDIATRDRLIAGAMLPAQVLVQSQRFRRWFRNAASILFDEFDVLLAPATPCTAPEIGQNDITIGGKSIPVRANLGIFTQPLSFIGLPVITIPVFLPGALPLGVQLIGPPGGEAMLFQLAQQLERMGLCGPQPIERYA